MFLQAVQMSHRVNLSKKYKTDRRHRICKRTNCRPLKTFKAVSLSQVTRIYPISQVHTGMAHRTKMAYETINFSISLKILALGKDSTNQ